MPEIAFGREFALDYYRKMQRIRVLEETLIGMVKAGEGFFWTGGPGEEAAAVALAAQIRKGRGLDFDFIHPHYRNLGLALTLGVSPADIIRQLRGKLSDPFSGGRNFVSHFSIPAWNICPVTSPIGSQFVVGLGTARAQRRHFLETGAAGITLVIAGEAGTAMGDFSSALVWASRPGEELPILIVITNNNFGISTDTRMQLPPNSITKRAAGFNLRAKRGNGLDARETFDLVADAFHFVRNERRPCILELNVSRLYGHSSSSGANRNLSETCPIENFEKFLRAKKYLDRSEITSLLASLREEMRLARIATEHDALPRGSDIFDHVYAP